MTGMTISAPALPADCLAEHLDYFNDNVASSIQFSATNFDDIFYKDLASTYVYSRNTEVNFEEPWEQQSAKKFKSVHVNHNEYLAQEIPAPVASVGAVPDPVPSFESMISMTPFDGYDMEPIPFHMSAQVTHVVEVPSFMPAPSVPASRGIKHSFQHMYPPSEQLKARPFATPASPKSVKDVIEESHVVTPTVSPKAVMTRKVAPSVPSTKPSATRMKYTPRQRSSSVVSVSSVTSAPTEQEELPIDTKNLSFQEQEDLRRERNRHHAKRSRQRKRNYMDTLEDAVKEMRKENERLRQLMNVDAAASAAAVTRDYEKKKALSAQKFIKHLGRPSNRILDNTTLSFLRELWK